MKIKAITKNSSKINDFGNKKIRSKKRLPTTITDLGNSFNGKIFRRFVSPIRHRSVGKSENRLNSSIPCQGRNACGYYEKKTTVNNRTKSNNFK
jgi:hypothetical protein